MIYLTQSANKKSNSYLTVHSISVAKVSSPFDKCDKYYRLYVDYMRDRTSTKSDYFGFWMKKLQWGQITMIFFGGERGGGNRGYLVNLLFSYGKIIHDNIWSRSCAYPDNRAEHLEKLFDIRCEQFAKWL